MATRGPTFGFRVKDVKTGRYRSNVVWVNPDFVGTWPADWVRRAVEESNG